MLVFLLLVGTIVLWTTAVLFAYFAVTSARTPQGSVAWVFLLLALPMVGIPAYLFLGNFRFKGYIVARRDSGSVIARIAEYAKEFEAVGDDDNVGYQTFENIAQAPIVSGNSIEILINGAATFSSIFAAIDDAKNYILVQFYIIKNDTLGREFKQKLIDAARRGVHVRLLFDAVGSSKLPTEYLADLEDSGIETVNAHSLHGPRTRFQINFRNHRKTLVVDGVIGFTGGLNVGDEYMGRDPGFGPWRDTHCRLIGPVVLQLQLVFSEDWHWATKQVLGDNLNWSPTRAPANMDALLMATGPADTLETGSLYFCAAISAAENRIWIASPYLVPDIDILTVLKLAALRGVDVRIMVPERPDHYITWLAAFAFLDELREVGVKILKYQDGFMHQKVLVVDEAIASIGTTNMDNRSCRLNFEATVMVFDKRAACAVAAMLEEDFTRCKVVAYNLNEKSRLLRVGAPIARLFAPLL
ncbi:cardiolipin synthase [Falsihalocynthiibacter arcticus]|uniref:Cardiolipin synthase n=1 Tax=Falsihalocynthiibacter arcticus TaxID=1579316 RepID=A0A126UY41_9RHOB|nr:cardiolipin synthase [Falsihalocynthiibacter arcticus]AML50960.1 cardiolipin synthase [Falsihalocynthiibacter arcticus]